MRKAAVACGVVGLICFLAAGLLAFWITPAYIARLPGDENTTRTYVGRIASLVDPSALRQANFAAAVKVGLPQTINRQTKVLQTSGNTALVRDSSTATTSGQPIGTISEQYAVDRTSLEATTSHPSDWKVTNATGLTFNWPIPAEQRNYTGWERFTGTTTQLTYVREEQHAGISTYVFQASVPPRPIKNAQVLSALPASLPASVLQRAGQAGLISPSLLASLNKLFPNAATIPLGYTYQGTSTYWVDPKTGIVVDLSTSEKETAGPALPGGKIVPVLPILVGNYQGSHASVQAAVNDAKDGSNTITTWDTTVPLILTSVGFVLVVLAVVFWMRGRRPAGVHAA